MYINTMGLWPLTYPNLDTYCRGSQAVNLDTSKFRFISHHGLCIVCFFLEFISHHGLCMVLLATFPVSELDKIHR